MRRRIMYYIAAVIIIFIITAAFAVFAQGSADERNAEFLSQYGWEVSEKSVERSEITIPDPFDLVYENYNKLQTEAGLDLEKYKGFSGVRYTYIVLNYPQETDEEVRANVLCINDKPVAGDICTVSSHGFMHPLNYHPRDGG